MRHIVSICTTLFFVSIACAIAFANIVADPVLYLNAADNPAHPKAWKNLGFAVDPADKLSTTWAKVKRAY